MGACQGQPQLPCLHGRAEAAVHFPPRPQQFWRCVSVVGLAGHGSHTPAEGALKAGARRRVRSASAPTQAGRACQQRAC